MLEVVHITTVTFWQYKWLPVTSTVKQTERAEKLGRCLLPGRCLNERQSVELINDQQFHNLDYRHLTSASRVRHIKLLASLKCPLTLYIQVVTLSTISLTLNNSTFSPHSELHIYIYIYMCVCVCVCERARARTCLCVVWISEQTAIISLHRVNFVTETDGDGIRIVKQLQKFRRSFLPPCSGQYILSCRCMQQSHPEG